MRRDIILLWGTKVARTDPCFCPQPLLAGKSAGSWITYRHIASGLNIRWLLFLHLPQHSKQSPDEEKQEQQRESCQAVTRHFATPTSVRYNFVLSYLFVGTIIILLIICTCLLNFRKCWLSCISCFIIIYLLFVVVYFTLEKLLIVMYLMFYRWTSSQ